MDVQMNTLVDIDKTSCPGCLVAGGIITHFHVRQSCMYYIVVATNQFSMHSTSFMFWLFKTVHSICTRKINNNFKTEYIN